MSEPTGDHASTAPDGELSSCDTLARASGEFGHVLCSYLTTRKQSGCGGVVNTEDPSDLQARARSGLVGSNTMAARGVLPFCVVLALVTVASHPACVCTSVHGSQHPLDAARV